MNDVTVDEISPRILHSASLSRTSDNRSDFQRKVSIWLILSSAGFERLAFYSLAGNLVLFLTSDNIRWTPFHSVTASFIFLGTSYISALVFAWLSDGKLGRATTIVIGKTIRLIHANEPRALSRLRSVHYWLRIHFPFLRQRQVSVVRNILWSRESDHGGHVEPIPRAMHRPDPFHARLHVGSRAFPGHDDS